MSFLLRYVPALLLATFVLTVPLFAQSTTPGKPARGTISGRITIKDKAAAGVVVGIRKAFRGNPFESDPPLKTVTDQDGNYRVTNLAAGNYEVMPSVPAYVVAGGNLAKTKSVNVGDDENVESINFSLVRGGVITGRVLDADGRPVIQHGVQLYRTDVVDKQSQQQIQPDPMNASVTDDRGIYRMYGLNAGRYKISAGKADDAFSAPGMPGRSTYKQVFHPDVTDVTKATIIEVSEGSEAKDVDITLGRALQTHSASGRVVDEKNAPVPGLRFGLQRVTGQRMEFVNTMAVSNSQGDFFIEGLIPGKYGIYIFPNQGEDARVPSFNFEIVDQDVSGLTLRLTKGGSISGIVTVESEDKTAFEKVTKMQLRAFISVGGGFGGSSSSPISPDGSFRLPGLSAGNVQIILGSMMGPAPGFTISRIERDGVAIPRTIEIKDGENITGVRVVVTYGTATLRGVVKLENGTLPEGGSMFVRLGKPGDPAGFSRPWGVDSRGHFVMENISPGLYELSVMVFTQKGETVKTVKREVTVQEAVANEVAITIDMSAPNP